MPSRWERSHDLNPRHANANADPDGDGLRNLGEFNHRTMPHGKDSDHDGLFDGLEVHRFHTWPRSTDSDDDGIEDGSDDGNENGIPDEGEDGDEVGFVGVILSYNADTRRLLFESAMGWPVTALVTGDSRITFVDCPTTTRCSQPKPTLREGQDILALRFLPETYKGVPVVDSMTVACSRWD